MFNTIFGEFPVNSYINKDYSRAIDSLANDVLKLTAYSQASSYSLKEIGDSLIFDCVATSIEKENLSITFKDRKLIIKTVGETKGLSYFMPINLALPLRRNIDIKSSYAELTNGVLKITMPVKEETKENKISFK